MSEEQTVEEQPAPKPTVKTLDERLSVLETTVSTLVEGFHQMELDASRPSGPEGTPEYAQDLLVAVISALRALRQQGAYAHALELEAKYFEGRNVQQGGDVVTTTQSLNS